MKKIKEILNKLGLFAILVGLTFGFLTICNWGYNPIEWNGFSRVLLGIFIFVPIIKYLDDLR